MDDIIGKRRPRVYVVVISVDHVVSELRVYDSQENAERAIPANPSEGYRYAVVVTPLRGKSYA